MVEVPDEKFDQLLSEIHDVHEKLNKDGSTETSSLTVKFQQRAWSGLRHFTHDVVVALVPLVIWELMGLKEVLAHFFHSIL